MTTRAEAHSANGTCFATRKWFVCVFFMKYLKVFVYIYIPRKSKDQTLPIGSRESFTWIILKTILCLVLDFQGIYIYYIIYVCMCNNVW